MVAVVVLVEEGSPLPIGHFPVKVNADNAVKRRGRCVRCQKNNKGWTVVGTVMSK